MMKKFLTSKEAADYLGMPEEELQKLSEDGRIPSYRIGGIYTRYKIDDLSSYKRRSPAGPRQRYSVSTGERIRDFFYFNDFYIFSLIAVITILYFIFK